MLYKAIGAHLRPYIMVAKRRTTINHAFASATAPSDPFDDARVRGAIMALGQDPDDHLRCVYCLAPAETWDHVFATVKDSRFSGHGHRLGNLLPCCKPCNSKKGNKDWRVHLASIPCSDEDRANREAVIADYLVRYGVVDEIDEAGADHAALESVRQKVLDLLAEGDQIAARIRADRLPPPRG